MMLASDTTRQPVLRILDHMLVLLTSGAPHSRDFVAAALERRASEAFVAAWIAEHC